MPRPLAIASFACLLSFATSAAHATQEVPTDAASAYRIVENMRNEALAPLRKGEVNDAEFAAAMKKIDGVLQYLQTPLIRDLSNGDKFLRARRFNTLLEISSNRGQQLS